MIAFGARLLRGRPYYAMRRFFLFAVLWAALFGPGHVLAACPMALPAEQGSQAPCHSDEDRGATTTSMRGHNCCVWVTPSSASGKFFTEKIGKPFGDLATGSFAGATPVEWHALLLTHPPPLPVPDIRRSAIGGSDIFLRTGRLRL